MTPCVPVPRPSYSQARESLVKAMPPNIICMLACGGRDCRYEGPACWRASQQAVRGTFSSWVTDDIVAMARPSTWLIKRYSIIEQFQQLNIRTIINMQLPGEHPHCGPPLEEDSGFTYSPQIFMESQIYFYNFGMPDFGVSSMVGMLDAVKVLAFSVKEGKVAVHCHAGLGRTGVLIACYLVYLLRVSPGEAIHYVRIKRPRSIQTRDQINMVFDFARLLASQLAQYPGPALRHGAPFGLGQYLQRQALLLHGAEARTLSHTPKILQLLCCQLTALTAGGARPAEVQEELDKRAAILALRQVVRDTLVVKKFLPRLRDEGKSHRSSSMCSVSSWDEPLSFLQRKREVLLNKRSYSESDLSKITLTSDPAFGQHSPVVENLKACRVQEVTAPGPALNGLGGDRWNGAEDRQTSDPPSATKRSKCTMKKSPPFSKYSSNVDLCRNHSETPGQMSTAKEVATALALQSPAGDRVLARAALLQDELNGSVCGWAALAVETDPRVLASLLWAWLERLKDPVLSAADVQKLTRGDADQKPLNVLHKCQRCTVSCLLRCVGQVAGLYPKLEVAILQRLIRALTRRPPEDAERSDALLQVLRTSMRELLHHPNITQHQD
ncbi:protein tyrosine phosphatase domain-containing protein 1 [Denticeps clupeoides]|uniref:Protein tyrosine phosphatase domain-containing protein 1 n=1 Tax=Denticeps clupeoides TaxID=299321 RepID=A0AAY4DKA1_9TELE|nr:protein tyrosine phosphatase domain-containing protein 1-like [Denticeps clupeoides]